ncbi:helix-turn-helix domain-containing protein [Agromyces sp. CFH 90414]|uniref:Helix-turn-helix domain-containing protein n=1 Tax=Agromyces agglutinans TaxID=2662258 RepID=A0A6I2F3L2_9MICO|nr:AraC family transcriptional regulator [Agromyces agglutinans]MRG59159.1 helix-turn-helix domain-containing protein [Agromyces agglutinans]
MYDPAGNATDKAGGDVVFEEALPPPSVLEVVHRFVSLRTGSRLASDYRFHALPDACTYVIFDQRDPRICGITRLRAASHELDLGREFHFTNVRLLPGTWAGDSALGMIDAPYTGDLPLIEFGARLHERGFVDQQAILVELIEWFADHGLVSPNPTTRRIFEQIDEIHTVADMARAACLSPRQLQRTMQQSTGFAPHDFLKVIRLQQTLRSADHSSYADQSHFIRSFRAATGYTPGQFSRAFDV